MSKFCTWHYNQLAAFIAIDIPEGVIEGSKRRVALRLAKRLADLDPEFDAERFLRACGVTS